MCCIRRVSVCAACRSAKPGAVPAEAVNTLFVRRHGGYAAGTVEGYSGYTPDVRLYTVCNHLHIILHTLHTFMHTTLHTILHTPNYTYI